MWALVVNTCETPPRTPRNTWEKFSKTWSLALCRCGKSWWHLGYYYQVTHTSPCRQVRLRETQVIDLKYVTMDWPRSKQLPISSKETQWKNKKKKRPTDCGPLLRTMVNSCFLFWSDWLPQEGFRAKVSWTRNLEVILTPSPSLKPYV